MPGKQRSNKKNMNFIFDLLDGILINIADVYAIYNTSYAINSSKQ